MIFILHFNSYCQSSDKSKEVDIVQSNNHSSEMVILDSLFMESNYEEMTQVLVKMSKQGDTNVLHSLSYLEYISNTVIELTKSKIQSSSFIVSLENIKLLDDLDYYLTNSDLGWKSFLKEISILKCQFNLKLQKKFSIDINKAYNYKSVSNIELAGKLIAESQFYRLKFYRDKCFDKLTYDNNVKKIKEISNWIEKTAINSKYQAISDNQPEWVKLGMNFEQYQELWAQRLTAGSEYMGGGCNTCGKSLYRGKRGGVYKINSSGNKQYVPKH